MNSSQNRDLILSVFSDARSVFSLTDVGMLLGETNFKKLNERLNYYVSRGKLHRPRKGVYAKPGYNPEELACMLYTPSYISLEYVLQKAAVVFQYDERITSVSYLSRTVDIEGRTYAYRKIKDETLIVTEGVIQTGTVNIATPERAFLDTLYLNSNYYFDNLSPLNRNLITKLLPAYNSKTLTLRVKKLFTNGEY